MGEERANPYYWDAETQAQWAAFVSGSKSSLVRQEAWWDIVDVEERDQPVDDIDWNA